MNFSMCSLLQRSLFCLILAVAPSQSVRAQLEVTLSMPRTTFVTDEVVTATLTVKNLAGKNVVLGGPSNSSWALFDLRNADDGTMITATTQDPFFPPMVIKKDQALTKTINLGSYYYLGEPRNYVLTASVYFPDLETYTKAPQRHVFHVVNPRTPFWKKAVGVTDKNGKHQGYRSYELSNNRIDNKEILYIRIKDVKTDRTLTTYPFGPILGYRDPQASTDRDGNLHVLYMGGPNVYAYVILGPTGAIIDQKTFLKGETLPELRISSDSVVTVRGGKLSDPIADAAKPEKSPFHKLSERPEGLPQDN